MQELSNAKGSFYWITAKEIQEEINKHIAGKIEPAHDATGHHYRFVETGAIVDSVTTKMIIDKPHLARWAGRIAATHVIDNVELLQKGMIQSEELITRASLAHQDIRDTAGDIGTKAHYIIECYLKEWIEKRERPKTITSFIYKEEDPQVIAACRSAENLLKRRPITPIATELLVGSEKRGVAGTLDFLALFEDKLYVVDWKTSNSMSEDYAIQVAAYAGLFKEMSGLKIHGCKIAHLSKKNNQYALFNIPYYHRAYAAAKHMFAVYDWFKNGQVKLTKDRNWHDYE